MKAKILIFIGLCLLASSCAIQPVYIENIEKPNLDNVNLGHSEVKFNVILKNPNKIGFRLVRSDLKVSVNGAELGFIGLAQKTKVKANGSTAIPVSVKVDSGKLLSIGAMSLFSDPKLEINGYVKGRKFLFSKKYKVAYQENISIQDFLGR